MKCLTIDFIILSLCEVGLIFAYLNWFWILAENLQIAHEFKICFWKPSFVLKTICFVQKILGVRGVSLVRGDPSFSLKVNHSFFCITAAFSVCVCHYIRLGSLREGPVAYSDLHTSAWPSACVVHSGHLVSVCWTEMCFSLWGGLPYELTEGDIICVFSQ